ncbi:MAG: DUF3352 domain-containing protein [Nodosilinea sp.]
MKFRTFIIPLAVAAGLVLVLGLGLLGGLVARAPLYLIERGGQSTPLALQFVPKQSPLVASVLTRPDRLAQLWAYRTAPKLRQEAQRDIEQIERTLLADTGLVYDRDIQPWLGEEITAAVVTTDIDQNPANGLTPGYLVALACRDSALAKTTLELFWQNRAVAGEALTFEDFSGNRLIYVRRLDTSTQKGYSGRAFDQLATAVVANQFVLVASHPDVLRQALTAAQAGDTSLRSDRRYKSALRTLPNNRVGLLVFNLPKVADWLHPAALPIDRNDALDVTLSASSELDNRMDWGIMSVALTPQGILADTALVAAQGHRLEPRRADLGDWPSLTRYLPDTLPVAAVGSDLGHLAQELGTLLTPLWPTATFANPLARSLDGAFGAGTADQVITGASQGYALGLSPLEENADWLLITHQSPAMDEALQSLAVLAQQRGLGAGALSIQDYPTTAWTRLSLSTTPQLSGSATSLAVATQVAGIHAKIDQYEVLTDSPTMMDTVLGWRQGDVRQPLWTQQVSLFTQPSEAYVHLDWPQVQAGLMQQIPRLRLWEAAARPALRHVQQITLSSYGRTEQIQTGGIFFRLD